MSGLKSILAFVLSIAAIFLFYNYVSIPILPSVSIYIFMALADNHSGGFHSLLVWGAALFGVYLYGRSAIESIIHYPVYLSIFGIILEFLTVFAFIGAGAVNASAGRYNKQS